MLQVSKRQIDKSRRLKSQHGICEVVPKEKIKRNRMNLSMAEDFINYLFETERFMVSSYETTAYKMSDSSKFIVPRAVLTTLKSYTVNSYMNLCAVNDIPTLSKSSLLRIIEAINPSKNKQISCLDNNYVDFTCAMKSIRELVLNYFDSDFKHETMTNLSIVENYIKFEYFLDCSSNSKCISHCPNCLLSSEKNENLKQICPPEMHTLYCNDCDLIVTVLQEIDEFLDRKPSEVTDEDRRNFKIAKESIFEYLKHKLRGYQQNQAKISSFLNVNDHSAIWLRDWSMKVLPLEHREAQKNFFGKSGLSKHVDVFFFKNAENQLEKVVYHTIVGKSDQGLVETLSVSEYVLSQLSKDNPQIKKLTCRSDNAQCYSANGCFEGLRTICKKFNLNLERYDFSEAQMGKDQCDREGAISNKKFQAFVNSGGNVQTSIDLKKAIYFHGRPKGTKVAVIDINSSKCNLNGFQVIEGISKIHSVSFSEKSLTYWWYFNIGEGVEIPYGKCQFVASYEVMDGFENDNVNASMISTPSTVPSIWMCNNESCTQTFEDFKSLEIHQLSGQHTIFKPETTEDKIKLFYMDRAVSDSLMKHPQNDNCYKNNSSDAFKQIFKPGWAIPLRKSGRLNVQVKDFCIREFINGFQKNNRKSANDVFHMQSKDMDSNGNKSFHPNDWLTVSQINSLYQRVGQLVGQLSSSDLSGVCQESNIETALRNVSKCSLKFCKFYHKFPYNFSAGQNSNDKCYYR